MPTKPTAAQRAAAHVRRPEFDGLSLGDWDQIPAHLGSSNQWRRDAGRRPRADALPVARVNCQPPWFKHRRPDWHPLFSAAETESTSRKRREAEARGETQAPTELLRPRAATQEFAMQKPTVDTFSVQFSDDQLTLLDAAGTPMPLSGADARGTALATCQLVLARQMIDQCMIERTGDLSIYDAFTDEDDDGFDFSDYRTFERPPHDTESLQLTSVHAFRDKSGDTAVVLGTDRGVIMPDELAADDQLPRSVRNAVLHDARRLIDQAIGDDFDFDFSGDEAS